MVAEHSKSRQMLFMGSTDPKQIKMFKTGFCFVKQASVFNMHNIFFDKTMSFKINSAIENLTEASP
jgi:hypothetical protein